MASLRAQSGQLKTQLAAVRGELGKLNADELRLAETQREVDLLDADYRKYSANLEQARIDQQLETERMSNVSVVQPASYEPRPVRPRVALNLLLGLCAGHVGRPGPAAGCSSSSTARCGRPRTWRNTSTCPSWPRFRASDPGNWPSTEKG